MTTRNGPGLLVVGGQAVGGGHSDHGVVGLASSCSNQLEAVLDFRVGEGGTESWGEPGVHDQCLYGQVHHC